MSRKIINISMPEELEEFVRLRIQMGRYGSVSEYFRELVRLDRQRERERVEEAERRHYLQTGYHDPGPARRNY